jgi:hypothetical protein
MPAIGIIGNQGVMKCRFTSGRFNLSEMAATFTNVNSMRMRMSATLATLLSGSRTEKRMIIVPLTRSAVEGVWFFRWSLPNLYGRLPSRPIAKETLDAEKTIEFTAAIEPMIIPIDIRAPPMNGTAFEDARISAFAPAFAVSCEPSTARVTTAMTTKRRQLMLMQRNIAFGTVLSGSFASSPVWATTSYPSNIMKVKAIEVATLSNPPDVKNGVNASPATP